MNKRKFGLAVVVLALVAGSVLYHLNTKPEKHTKSLSNSGQTGLNPVQTPTKLSAKPPSPEIAPTAGNTSTPDDAFNVKRAKIYDSTSLLSTAFQVLASGTQDEKAWVHDLLSDCRGYAVSRPLISPSPSQAQLDALHALQLRCNEIATYPPAELKALLEKLKQGGDGSSSEYGRVVTISAAAKKDAHYSVSESDSALIQQSLYSEDAVLRRAAFWTVVSLMAAQPDGSQRVSAFISAVADDYVNQPLSEFERLELCAGLAKCGGSDDLPKASATAPSAAEASLIEEFSKAIHQRAPINALIKRQP